MFYTSKLLTTAAPITASEGDRKKGNLTTVATNFVGRFIPMPKYHSK